jgi:hypothetical protein
MLGYYLGALAFGGVLILASLVFGDTDSDVDTDVDMDADIDGEVELDPGGEMFALDDPADVVVSRWNPLFSMRFWTFALASFGLTGTLLTWIGVPAVITAALATMMGIGLGLGAAWMFRTLSRSQVSAKTSLNQIRGVHGTVLLPIRPGGTGKIRMLIDEQAVDVLARTSMTSTMQSKSTVLVVNVEDGIANVTCLPGEYREPSKE